MGTFDKSSFFVMLLKNLNIGILLMIAGDLENIFAEKKHPALLQAVRNILLLNSFVLGKLLLNTLREVLFVGMLQLFSVFHEFCKMKTY